MAIHDFLWAWAWGKEEKRCCGEGLGLSGEFQTFLRISALLQTCTNSCTQSSHTQNSHLSSNTQTQNTYPFSRINIPAQTAERNQTGPWRSFLWLLRNEQTNKQGDKPQELPHNSICCLYLQKSLIKQDAFRFWGQQLSFKEDFISSLQVLYFQSAGSLFLDITGSPSAFPSSC